MAQTPIVRIRELTRVFRQGEINVTALDRISLDIEAGEFLTLMGPSGSGKSTLLHLIAGIDRPTSGACIVQEHNIAEMDESALADWRNQNVGFVFQTFNLIPVLTAYENVELPLLLTQLSGKERRRLVTDPKLVVADEPTGNLDSHSAADVMEILRTLSRDAGKTVIMVTHDPKAAAFGTRSIHLEKGELVA